VSAIIFINWWHNFQEADDYEEETNNIWDDDFGVRSAAALHTTTTSTTPEPKIQAASKTNKNLCRRKPLYVDFAEIQYDSWVLAPTGYEVSKTSTFPTTQTKNIIFLRQGISVRRQVRLPHQRSPHADKALGDPNAGAFAELEASAKGVLRAYQTQTHLHALPGRRRSPHLQVQLRGHGCCGMRLSMN
jgi:Transforming growth factor beta like domain